jgi:protoporphyrinogen IX oxidase
MWVLLVAVHIMANVVWIGAISSVGWVTRRSAQLDEVAGKALATTAYHLLYKRAAAPAFAISFFAGVTRVAQDPKAYFSFHWFHGKLFFALLVIALHHVIGAKAKKAAAGSSQGVESSATLTGALLAATFLTVVFAVMKASLVP